jgi:hypothetical protein
MAHEMAWKTPGKVLNLKMSSTLSLEEFVEIDKQISEHLQESDERITLIVDGSDARFSPYSIERVKATQRYLNSYKICQLIVVGDKKLNRLAMLLLFNLCRPKLQFCDSIDQAQHFVDIARS